MLVSGESFYGLDTAFIRSFPALKYPSDLKLRLESDPNWFGKMFGNRLSHTPLEAFYEYDTLLFGHLKGKKLLISILRGLFLWMRVRT